MGVTNFDVVQANAFLGYALPTVNPFSKVIYVNTTKSSDANSGLTPALAKLTLASALTAAAAGDVIVMGPGTYTITTTLNPAVANITIRAAIYNPLAPTVTIQGNIATLLTLDQAGCQFWGIEFFASGTTPTTLVACNTVNAFAGAVFSGCVFNGGTATTCVGLSANSATLAISRLLVLNCRFINLTSTGIQIGVMGAAHSIIAYNVFSVDTAALNAISIGDTASFTVGKGLVIERNTFFGFSNAAAIIPILITAAGGDGTTGATCFRDNDFPYCATAAITASKLSKGVIENFIATSGGTLVTG